MIFVTVGTHQQPFERLIGALASLDCASLVVQYGYAEAPEGVAHATAFMTFPEMLRHFDEAEAVITHAGVGSILCATNAGHVPIVVPRLKRFGEHVDDHQVELAQALGRAGRVIVAWRAADLVPAIEEARRRARPDELHETRLHAAVREALSVTSPGPA